MDSLSLSEGAMAEADKVDTHSINTLDIEQLRRTWIAQFGSQPPNFQSTDTLRRIFAWRMQEQLYGGLDKETIGLISQAQKRIGSGHSPVPRADLSLVTGMVLVREWRGVTHRVQVLDSGFLHNGKRYRTLSHVACAITGTTWSGPRFFGLEAKRRQKVEAS